MARRLASYFVEYVADPYAQQLVAGRTMATYEGEICMPERYVREELESVSKNFDRFNVINGWVMPDHLAQHSPDAIAFAFLDMDVINPRRTCSSC